MLLCPGCRTTLTPFAVYNRSGMRCLRCGGCGLSRSFVEWLCREELAQALDALWDTGKGEKRGACPSCRAAMLSLPFELSPHDTHPWEPRDAQPPLPPELRAALRMSRCETCDLLWMDDRSFRSLPMRERGTLEEESGLEPSDPYSGSDEGAPPSEPLDRAVADFAGLPFKENVRAPRSAPVATRTLAAALLLVGYAIHGDEALKALLSLQPRLFRNGTWFEVATYPFVFRTPFELLSNTYFLLLFGSNSEDALGPLAYGALLAGSSFGAGAMHFAFAPELPARGATGLVAGLTAFFALAFPRARVGTRVGFGVFDYWMRFPPIIWLAFWFLTQVAVALYKFIDRQDLALFSSLGDILGGASAGALVWAFGYWRKRSP